MLDAIVGEVVVTCEKIHWLCNEGEKWLKPERRSAGIMASLVSPLSELISTGGGIGMCFDMLWEVMVWWKVPAEIDAGARRRRLVRGGLTSDRSRR
jgi:hypothetical protein